MSELRVNTITDETGGNTATINGMTPTADSLQGFRNRLINSDMRIDQRNAGASVTITNVLATTFITDRWGVYGSITSKFSAQQNAGAVTPPPGFTNYLGATSLSSYSVTSGEFYQISQGIEGFNIADLGWGTANAQSITLGFWVRSSLTGAFSGAVQNSAFNRSYPFSFTINAANTWEYKTVTVPGDTSGTWLTNNGLGISLVFNLGAGANNLGTAGAWVGAGRAGVTGSQSIIGTSGATFYITGVQLEAGSVATPFERRPYGTELQLAQRYYYRISTSGATYQSFGLASGYNALQMRLDTIFPVTMRTAPTSLEASAASSFLYEKEAGYAVSPSAIVLGSQSSAFVGVSVGTTSSVTAGGAVYHTYSNGTPAYLGFSAEL